MRTIKERILVRNLIRVQSSFESETILQPIILVAPKHLK